MVKRRYFIYTFKGALTPMNTKLTLGSLFVWSPTTW